MNIAVRYQSRGGNTRAVAEVIAETVGVKAEPIDMPLDGQIDLLFLGGGVYKWDADEKLLDYLNTLNASNIAKIAPFSTTGAMTVTIKRIREYAQKAGISVSDKDLCLKVMLQGHSALGRTGGNLKEEQREKVKQFALDTIKCNLR